MECTRQENDSQAVAYNVEPSATWLQNLHTLAKLESDPAPSLHSEHDMRTYSGVGVLSRG